ncbi:MAG: ABC transporter permease, partial [Ktedonobacterales bacterium]|nr:ABC transporter permease [Ktedonobacterales bacterium]
PDVTSATIGYNAAISAQTNAASTQVTLNAVNADTYAQTSVWTASNSAQSVSELMGLLRANRANATAQNTVPAIVDEALWSSFHLAQDPHFTLSVPGYNATSLHLIAVGHIAHISGIYDLAGYGDNAGVLTDFASYAAVYQHDTATTLQQNYVWLHVGHDEAALTTLRAMLNDANNPLHLNQLLDRRAIISNAARDPLVIDLLGVLAICTVTAGVLGVLGALVAAWLSARSRLTNFAVLRALGSTPGQTARVLVWEQAIITATALSLGLVLGLILAGAILPTLIFTNLLTRQNTFIGAINVPPIQTIIPFGAVAVVVGGVAVIFLIMLALMTRVVARPSVSQTLRLNED